MDCSGGSFAYNSNAADLIAQLKWQLNIQQLPCLTWRQLELRLAQRLTARGQRQDVPLAGCAKWANQINAEASPFADARCQT